MENPTFVRYQNSNFRSEPLVWFQPLRNAYLLGLFAGVYACSRRVHQDGELTARGWLAFAVVLLVVVLGHVVAVFAIHLVLVEWIHIDYEQEVVTCRCKRPGGAFRDVAFRFREFSYNSYENRLGRWVRLESKSHQIRLLEGLLTVEGEAFGDLKSDLTKAWLMGYHGIQF